MSLSTSFLGKILGIIVVGSLAFATHSFDLKELINLEEKQEIHILDQQIQATILAVRHEPKSELLKGSILDYEGIYITYEFLVDDQLFRKTEVIKKSEGNLTQFLQSIKIDNGPDNKVAVRYSSKDPRKSVIEISNVLASS